jgi:hypothetical protein
MVWVWDGVLLGDRASVPAQPDTVPGSSPDYEIGKHTVAYAYKRLAVVSTVALQTLAALSCTRPWATTATCAGTG